jgi:hypothetical protein
MLIAGNLHAAERGRYGTFDPAQESSAPGPRGLAAVAYADRRACEQREGTTMFESPQEQVPDNKVGIWIGVAIVAVIAAGFFIYVSRKPSTSSPSAAVSTASMGGTTAPGADPVKDLRVVSVTMDKDPSGTTAQWLVDLKNESPVYTYSNIQYQTTYIGANETVLLVNHGKLNLTLNPGDDQSTQFRDALYPDGTSVYKIIVTGATASK